MNALNVVLLMLTVWFFLRANANVGVYAWENKRALSRLVTAIILGVILGQRLGGWL